MGSESSGLAFASGSELERVHHNDFAAFGFREVPGPDDFVNSGIDGGAWQFRVHGACGCDIPSFVDDKPDRQPAIKVGLVFEGVFVAASNVFLSCHDDLSNRFSVQPAR